MNIVRTLMKKEEDLVDVLDQHEEEIHLMKQMTHHRHQVKMNPCRQHEYVIHTHTLLMDTHTYFTMDYVH